MAYATIFHDGIGLMAIGVLLLPVTVIILPIYILGLFLMRVTTRRIYLWEMIALLGLTIALGLGIITFSYFNNTRYDVAQSQMIDDKSYHLIFPPHLTQPLSNCIITTI